MTSTNSMCTFNLLTYLVHGNRAFAAAGSKAWNSLYRQPSAQSPNRSPPSKKNLNCFFLDFRLGRDNVYTDFVQRARNSSYRSIALNQLS